MLAFRNSQLRLRRQCGFAYLMAYKRPVPPSPSAVLDAGRSVHDAAQLLVRRIVEGGPIDIHDVAFRTIRGGPQEYAAALRVLTRIQEAIGVEFDIDPRQVFLLEEKLAMPVALRDGRVVEFFGTPDLGEKIGKGVCRIRDWKTHWIPETPEEFGADQQLKRYALLIAEHYPGMDTFVIEKRFVRWQDSFVQLTITRDELRSVREALISEIEATLELDEAGDYEATPGEWCGLCQVHALCPRIREFLDADRDVDIPSIADDDHARSLAADAHALEQAATRIKGRLKRYLGAEHPKGYVPLPGGGYYGFGPANHRELDHAVLCSTLVEHGVEPGADLANVNWTALDRLMRKLPETVVQKLEEKVHRYQSPQFRYRRALTDDTAAAAAAPQEELF